MIPNERYYCSLLIQVINSEANEALDHQGLPIGVRQNLKSMLAEASKAQARLAELADDSWVKKKLEERR